MSSISARDVQPAEGEPAAADHGDAEVQHPEPELSDGSAKQLAQVHVAPLFLGELEQRRRLEVEQTRDDQVGEGLDPDVVQVDRLVVELAAVGDRLLEFRDARSAGDGNSASALSSG